jgi:hypothetical protein
VLKYASLRYDHEHMNLGDSIQTLAAERFLPSLDKRFDRDTLGDVEENDIYLLIMNGWFTTRPEKWPPGASIAPVFFGFHLNIENNKDVERIFLNDKSLEYFKRHEPIGCRDRATAKMLSERGIKTFYSKCLTLTFTRRSSEPENGKIFLVDIDPKKIPLPEAIERKAVRVSHSVPHIYPDEVKLLMAKSLLDMYKNEARLVITTRLHCALPCIALGVPVIFFGNPDEYRVAILPDLGVPIYRRPNKVGQIIYRWLRSANRRFGAFPVIGVAVHFLYGMGLRLLVNRQVDWQPQAVSIEAEKQTLKNLILTMLQQRIVDLRSSA